MMSPWIIAAARNLIVEWRASESDDIDVLIFADPFRGALVTVRVPAPAYSRCTELLVTVARKE